MAADALRHRLPGHRDGVHRRPRVPPRERGRDFRARRRAGAEQPRGRAARPVDFAIGGSLVVRLLPTQLMPTQLMTLAELDSSCGPRRHCSSDGAAPFQPVHFKLLSWDDFQVRFVQVHDFQVRYFQVRLAVRFVLCCAISFKFETLFISHFLQSHDFQAMIFQVRFFQVRGFHTSCNANIS